MVCTSWVRTSWACTSWRAPHRHLMGVYLTRRVSHSIYLMGCVPHRRHGLYLMACHGLYLMACHGLYLMACTSWAGTHGLYLMGVYLISVHLMGVHLRGMHLTGHASHGRALQWRAPHWACTPSHGRARHWPAKPGISTNELYVIDKSDIQSNVLMVHIGLITG